jgi:hypothetical protein
MGMGPQKEDPNYDPEKDPTLHPGPTITAPRLLDRTIYPQARAQQDAFESSYDQSMGQTRNNWHNPNKSEAQTNSDQKYFTETLPELFGDVVEMEAEVIEFAFSFGIGGMVNQTGKSVMKQSAKRQIKNKVKRGAELTRKISELIKEINLIDRIKQSGMSSKQAGEFFGWGKGNPAKSVMNFTKEILEQNGWTKEIIKNVAEGYKKIGLLDPVNPSALPRARQLESLIKLFE